jgi:hypothetical protein
MPNAPTPLGECRDDSDDRSQPSEEDEADGDVTPGRL